MKFNLRMLFTFVLAGACSVLAYKLHQTEGAIERAQIEANQNPRMSYVMRGDIFEFPSNDELKRFFIVTNVDWDWKRDCYTYDLRCPVGNGGNWRIFDLALRDIPPARYIVHDGSYDGNQIGPKLFAEQELKAIESCKGDSP